MFRHVVAALAAIAAATAACTTQPPPAGVPPSRSIPTRLPLTSVHRTVPAAATRLELMFVTRHGVQLPNRAITPGVVVPGVTKEKVCSHGLARPRHPSYGTKSAVLIAYGLTPDDSARYAINMLIPAGLGGSRSSRNLWPIRRTGAGSLPQKRTLEARLIDQVCSGRLSLATAQNMLRDDWWAAYQNSG